MKKKTRERVMEYFEGSHPSNRGKWCLKCDSICTVLSFADESMCYKCAIRTIETADTIKQYAKRRQRERS